MIQLSNVTKSYEVAEETFDVLSDVNLVIGKGEYMSIMGPSGSGKSTLMNIIGCLFEQTVWLSAMSVVFERKSISRFC